MTKIKLNNKNNYRNLMAGIICFIAFLFIELHNLKLEVAKYVFFGIAVILLLIEAVRIIYIGLCVLMDFEEK